MVTKEQEIKALIELIKMEGYFSDYFKRDLEIMIRNIKNDFPIEIDTTFHYTEQQWHQAEQELKKAHHNEIIDICDTLLCVHAETGNISAYEKAVAKLGLKFVIIRKRKLELSLTTEEIDYLISRLG